MTLLLFIRHGIAEPYRASGTDAERALTAEGWLKTRCAMVGLVARGFRPNRGISSPYRRAMESMACLREATPSPFPVGVWEGLEPEGDILQAEAWLRQLLVGAGTDEVIAFTSHQPLLGDLLHHLTGEVLDMRNACCAVVEWLEGRWRFQAHWSAEQLRGEVE